MKNITNILKFLWQLPIGYLLWFYWLIPLWIFKQITFVKRAAPLVLEFELVDRDTWFNRLWTSSYGSSYPYMFIRVSAERIKRDNPNASPEELVITMRRLRLHELHHNKQHEWHGPFFYPVYGFLYIKTWISNKWKKLEDRKDPYYTHPFEVAARNAARDQL